MIDDGKKVTLTPEEFAKLLADMAKVFHTDEKVLPWDGPREVYVDG